MGRGGHLFNLQNRGRGGYPTWRGEGVCGECGGVGAVFFEDQVGTRVFEQRGAGAKEVYSRAPKLLSTIVL